MFNVLVVDDDDSIILFMSRLLKSKFQCHVFRAENGLEALSIVEENNIQVVFLDITMPVLDGIETLKTLREKPKFKNLPVVMMTAVADKNIVSEIMQLGVLSYMLKPLMYDTSYKNIKDIFDSINEGETELAIDEETKVEEEAEDTREKILIIDPDNSFREDFKHKLFDEYIIFDTDSSPKGLNLFIKEKPSRVFLSENLSILSEYMLAEKIKILSKTFTPSKNEEENNNKVYVYLMKKVESNTSASKTTEKQKSLFDDELVKTSQYGILLRGSKCVIKY